MGLFDSKLHNLAEQALDATWYKQTVISNNIANSDTPDYKARTVDFALVLKEMSGYNKDNSVELKVSTGYSPNTNQILDGNNVDMEKEQLALADAQYQYSAMIDRLNHQYNMLRIAIQK